VSAPSDHDLVHLVPSDPIDHERLEAVEAHAIVV